MLSVNIHHQSAEIYYSNQTGMVIYSSETPSSIMPAIGTGASPTNSITFKLFNAITSFKFYTLFSAKF